MIAAHQFLVVERFEEEIDGSALHCGGAPANRHHERSR